MTCAPQPACARAMASASATWSPAATSTVEPVPSTVRSSGREAQVERDSCGTCMPLVTSKPCALKARDSSLPRKTIELATSSMVGKV